jgi:hypothetical protein
MTYTSEVAPAASPLAQTSAPGQSAVQTKLPIVPAPSFSYVDWPAILCGSLLALAASFVMLTFGSAMGLGMVSAEPRESASLRWIMIASGLWFIWVVVSSIGLGSYFAGRLRHPIGDAVDDEVELRDGAQGLAVWAFAVVLGAVMAAQGMANLTGAAASLAGQATATVAAVAKDSFSLAAASLVRDPAGTVAPSAELTAEATGILTRSVANGALSDSDRTYLSGRIAAETGRTAEAVETAVDAAMLSAVQAWETLQEGIETSRRTAIVIAFVIAATLIAAAAIGYFAAVAGGKHRDDNIPLRSLRH